MDEDVTHDGAGAQLEELARLRVRAYSADADIDADPAALARLSELEERARADRAAHARSDAVATPSVDATLPTLPRAQEPLAAAPVPRRVHWHTKLVAGVAAGAFVLGAAVAAENAATWWPAPGTNTPDQAAADALVSAPWLSGVAAEDAAHDWPASPDSYRDNLERLRQKALSGSNTEYEQDLRRLDVDALLPKGTIDGRSVWVGPSIDGVTCLILGGDDGPFIGCATAASLAERGIMVIAPQTPDVAATGPTHARFTLTADGIVTAEPLAVDGAQGG